jgi:hypothetical protein
VHRQQAGELGRAFGVERLERFADLAVQVAPLLLEERAVGRVLDQPVAEEVLELGPMGGDPDQALGLERLDLGVGHGATPGDR